MTSTTQNATEIAADLKRCRRHLASLKRASEKAQAELPALEAELAEHNRQSSYFRFAYDRAMRHADDGGRLIVRHRAATYAIAAYRDTKALYERNGWV